MSLSIITISVYDVRQMNEQPKSEWSREHQPTHKLDYLCGVAREILLKAPRPNGNRFRWRNTAEKLFYELSVDDLTNSADPLFLLKSKRIILPTSGQELKDNALYTFNKQTGISYESPIGTQITHRHNSDQDPVVCKLLGLIEPQLMQSEVLYGCEATTMRKEFDSITGRLALEHLYGMGRKPLLRQYIDQLAIVDNAVVAEETRAFLNIERKWHTHFSVRDDVFQASLNQIITGGIPSEWQQSIE